MFQGIKVLTDVQADIIETNDYGIPMISPSNIKCKKAFYLITKTEKGKPFEKRNAPNFSRDSEP